MCIVILVKLRKYIHDDLNVGWCMCNFYEMIITWDKT